MISLRNTDFPMKVSVECRRHGIVIASFAQPQELRESFLQSVQSIERRFTFETGPATILEPWSIAVIRRSHLGYSPKTCSSQLRCLHAERGKNECVPAWIGRKFGSESAALQEVKQGFHRVAHKCCKNIKRSCKNNKSIKNIKIKIPKKVRFAT